MGGSSVIHIENHGPLIIASNYWVSDVARAGKLWVSVNSGAVRVLLPPSAYGCLTDMRAARECVLSRGPWPEQDVAEAVEIMWDDGSDSPFALHLTPASFDLLPAEPEPGREWVCSTWTVKDGKPHKALERICHWRRVPRIPWMREWDRKSR
jgi:hypothetical protein